MRFSYRCYIKPTRISTYYMLFSTSLVIMQKNIFQKKYFEIIFFNHVSDYIKHYQNTFLTLDRFKCCHFEIQNFLGITFSKCKIFVGLSFSKLDVFVMLLFLKSGDFCKVNYHKLKIFVGLTFLNYAFFVRLSFSKVQTYRIMVY